MLIFGYPVLSCLPLFYLILSYLIVSSRITSYCKFSHLSTYELSAYNTDWATMKRQMFYVYYHIEISKILWENCCCLYFSVEGMEAQRRCNMLTLSKLASGRDTWLKNSCSPWLFHLTVLPTWSSSTSSLSFISFRSLLKYHFPNEALCFYFIFLLIFDFSGV